ncbi:MAG: hypothetical protein HY690_05815 [Chloroflexi bacterium]|nr:hypothetical protein [Chloroflexota bacterium]
MPEPIFDNQEQLDQIKSLLLPGETVEGVFRHAFHNILVLTSKRIVHARFSKEENVEFVRSIPYANVAGLTLSTSIKENMLYLHGTFSANNEALCNFYGDPSKARQAHDLILHHILGSP